MKVYPSWRYHKTQGAKVIQNEAEDKALGEGWVDSPAKFELEESEREKLLKLKEDELVLMLKSSGLKESTLKRRTKEQLVDMILEKK